jgi:hypothetical protein
MWMFDVAAKLMLNSNAGCVKAHWDTNLHPSTAKQRSDHGAHNA